MFVADVSVSLLSNASISDANVFSFSESLFFFCDANFIVSFRIEPLIIYHIVLGFAFLFINAISFMLLRISIW